MPSLAELRAQKDAPKVPESSFAVTLIEGQHLLAESQALAEERLYLGSEKDGLLRQARRVDEDGNRTGPPLKAGEKVEEPSRVAEIDARLQEITDREAVLLTDLAQFQATVGLRGWTGGEWQRWKDQHPAREGNKDDESFALGRCDYAALFGTLGSFVATWDGEAVAESDWDGWLAERIVYADRRDMVAQVVLMQEARVPRVPKSPSPSSTTEAAATD